jgi:hypothetical protein
MDKPMKRTDLNMPPTPSTFRRRPLQISGAYFDDAINRQIAAATHRHMRPPLDD